MIKVVIFKVIKILHLVEEAASKGKSDDPQTPNFWLSKDNKTGPGQGFTVDLGCKRRISGVILVNIHKDLWQDRGTKNFR